MLLAVIVPVVAVGRSVVATVATALVAGCVGTGGTLATGRCASAATSPTPAFAGRRVGGRHGCGLGGTLVVVARLSVLILAVVGHDGGGAGLDRRGGQAAASTPTT